MNPRPPSTLQSELAAILQEGSRFVVDDSTVRSVAADDTASVDQAWAHVIPIRFRWARADALDLLTDRTRPVGPDGRVLSLVVALERTKGWAGPVAMIGPPGSGKSSLAAACMHNRMRARRVTALWVPARDLAVVRSQSPLGAGEPALVRRACSVQLLVIDDLGQEARTASSAVHDVVCSRHDSGLSTWFTSGLERAQIAEAYGGGIARRMFERGLVIHTAERT